MTASGFFSNIEGKGTMYLCIVVGKWALEGGQETQGVFAQKVELTDLNDPTTCTAKVTAFVMKQSGLPVIPLQITVVKDDTVVRAWASQRDFLEEDVWDKMEAFFETGTWGRGPATYVA